MLLRRSLAVSTLLVTVSVGRVSSADAAGATPQPPPSTGILPDSLQSISDVTGLVANVFGAGQAIEAGIALLNQYEKTESNVDEMTQEFSALQSSLTTLESQAAWGDQQGACWDDQLKLQGDINSLIEAVRLGETVDQTSTPATDASEFTSAAENPQCFSRLFADSVTNGNPPQTTDGLTFTSVSPPGPLQYIWKDALASAGYGRYSENAVNSNGYIYDWRLGAPNFLEAIAMRLVAITAVDPNFKTDGVYSQDLSSYRSFLQTQMSNMISGVKCGYVEPFMSGLLFPGAAQGGFDPALFIISCADVNTGLNVTQDYYSPVTDVYMRPLSNVVWAWATNNLPSACDLFSQYCGFVPYYWGGDQALVNQVNSYMAPQLDTMRREILVQMPIFEMQAMINTLYLFIHGGPDLEFPMSPQFQLNYNYFCLDDGGSTTGAVQVAACNSSADQMFVYDRAANRIQNAATGACLSVVDGQLASGVLVTMAQCADSFAPQMWTYDPEKQVIQNKLGTVLAVIPGQIDQSQAMLWVEDQVNDAYEQWVP